jgi:predicted ATPase/class 3 adenylate cyclase/tetratricopeptide (TPR) repeat protein
MLPTGTVTFLFTDIEGSTQLWEKYPEGMKGALAKHDAILRSAIESEHGHVLKTTGDGVCAVFGTALEAVKAAVSAQHSLQAHPTDLEINVRMGVHTGEAELREQDYFGGALNRAARIMSIGHGGQILLSGTTASLVREQLPQNTQVTDLGEHLLKGLSIPEQIWQLVAPGLTAEFPALQSLSVLPNNLPIQLTSFVGREKEKVEIKAMLASARLVTLTGSGGTGKTRLTIEVGAEELTSFANGVWLIELAPLADPSQIIPALAKTFGLQELPFSSLAELVSDYLREKKILLIFDNCEHLIEACARLVNDLLHQCPELKVLASSREALGISGESSYRIPSLVESESICLFEERARAVNPKFALTSANAGFVAQICSRLDGIPLAIELAAARTKLLSAEQIAKRLDDRFRLLVGGSRTALPRQQTLRALIDWSYDLLSEEEKQLLRTASVFMGGWTLGALEAVADDPNSLEHLEQLVNKSLVITEERAEEMRYSMLETIRQYAREKLFDLQQGSLARDQHFFYYDELSEQMWEAFRSAEMSAWRERAEDEIENFRAAMEWGLEQHVEAALHLAANFCIVSAWIGSQQPEALALLSSTIERFQRLPPVEEDNNHRQNLLAKAFFILGLVGLSVGGFKLSLKPLQEAISYARLAGDKRMLGYSLEMYYSAYAFNDASGGIEEAREGFAIFSEIDDNWGRNMATMNMGRIAARQGDLSESQKYFDMLEERIKDAPIPFTAGMSLFMLGLEERAQGQLEIARGHFEEGRRLFRLLRHKGFETSMTSEIGHIARMEGDVSQAKEIYRQTILSFQELGNRPAVAHQLECFALIATAEAEPQRAVKLLGAAEALREKIESPMTDFERSEYDQAVARLHSLLPEAEFKLLWAEGRSLTREQAIRLALI